ncbi:uncharacterized protein LOC100489832 isoform X2 [Xenopus tropicalis]|uniref:Uncharacterized protein LOC100489832 isoform X2 n=1 Tax=Xenopus tropicalis TaxID=8364 RepID=A0A8J1JD34_XENTR|nr:uncharacterized protein LOC100489832 isoform X2 [Xenopus tropicalis]
MEHCLLVFELAFFHLILRCSSQNNCLYHFPEDIIIIPEQQFFLGTIINLSCNKEYQRERNTHGMYTCVNNSGVLKWKTEKDLKCIKKDGTTTSDQSMELEEKQHNHTDICAPLPHIPNARLTFVKVPVGQELHYMNKGTRANITQKCITENASGKYLGKESTTREIINNFINISDYKSCCWRHAWSCCLYSSFFSSWLGRMEKTKINQNSGVFRANAVPAYVQSYEYKKKI